MYIQFKESDDARTATTLNGETLSNGLKLVAEISDPSHKQQRHGALYEGRELFIKNMPFTANEKEVKELFSEYGKVESARIPRKFNGESKGIGFVVFRDRHDALKALSLHLKPWKSRTLEVVEATNDPAKRQASVVTNTSNRTTASPAPTTNDRHGSRAGSTPPDRDKRAEIQSRTFALLNVPDTVNESRIRALTEPHGELTKLLLRLDHQGAIIEYKDQSSAGKALLTLDGYEIAPGRALRVGTVEEMKELKAEHRSNKIETSKDKKKAAAALPAPTLVRRPGLGAQKRGRGGLGVKHGLGGTHTSRAKHTDGQNHGVDNWSDGGKERDGAKPKSNADFKAYFEGK